MHRSNKELKCRELLISENKYEEGYSTIFLYPIFLKGRDYIIFLIEIWFKAFYLMAMSSTECVVSLQRLKSLYHI